MIFVAAFAALIIFTDLIPQLKQKSPKIEKVLCCALAASAVIYSALYAMGVKLPSLLMILETLLERWNLVYPKS